MHHGTLLFNSDLKNLGQAIKVVPGKYESKAVQSNRSPVANISQFLKTPMTTGEFIQFLSGVQLENPENSFYRLNENDIQNIEKLSAEKFTTWEWNFGYSPKYSFKNEVEIDGKILKIEMLVERGRILESNIWGDYFTLEVALQLSQHHYNRKHFFEEVKAVLTPLQAEEFDVLCNSFF